MFWCKYPYFWKKIEYCGMFFTNLMKSDTIFCVFNALWRHNGKITIFQFLAPFGLNCWIFLLKRSLWVTFFYQTKAKISKISKIINKNLCLNTYWSVLTVKSMDIYIKTYCRLLLNCIQFVVYVLRALKFIKVDVILSYLQYHYTYSSLCPEK